NYYCCSYTTTGTYIF
nr:immunoglobulin light chain junction region [Macaca mulatta]MOX80607.1 immunoglobulin light chain junction region [Macaca mulatta]MOX80850.1 immunoglobulin light chain junction region [Macaca mulatta]MOX82394.1 immunoglobulin light chain junction region [Macaca mulatta]MOX82458.1 immunoglobulin light chain junction region [Macaca mulatta]